MRTNTPDFWTDDTSVLFTSYWGWTPETWGTVGWSGDRGLARRTDLLMKLTDPFITVVYVTSNKSYIDPGLKGKIAGFYLVSHETGDRDAFTHPIHHNRDPDKWRHSLRAIRAFSYIPEHRLSVSQLDPGLLKRARSVSSMCEVLTDRSQIALLRDTPWVEVEVYSGHASEPDDPVSSSGFVKAGPASKDGYVVSAGTQQLPRQLYILRLTGDTDAYLGKSANGCSIYKIGLSVSPELRRQAFQKSMPRGVFKWRIHRTSANSGFECCSFDAAVAGEDAMKRILGANVENHLENEFYLASEAAIEDAWQRGTAAAQSFGRKT